MHDKIYSSILKFKNLNKICLQNIQTKTYALNTGRPISAQHKWNNN